MFRILFAATMLTCSTVSAEPPFAPSRYYVTLYAHENWRNAAVFSHSYAEFTEVRADGTIRTVNISWIPEEGHMPGIRPLRMPIFGFHPGQNTAIGETIARAQQGGPLTRREVFSYGPYEIRQELFEKAEARKRDLDSGALQYSGLSTVLKRRREVAPVCVNALDLFGDVHSGLSRGRGATEAVLESYRRNGYVLEDVRSVQAQRVPLVVPPAPVVEPRRPLLGRLRNR